MFPPSRIVCLTEETVETLYLVGEQDRIVRISGYVVRPPRAPREKPRVSVFTSANIDKILALQPDAEARAGRACGHCGAPIHDPGHFFV
jgi:iron complex transport system substrate-binding protein